MRDAEFRSIGESLWGHYWIGPMSKALGVEPRSVRRWASGRFAVPEAVAHALLALKAARNPL